MNVQLENSQGLGPAEAILGIGFDQTDRERMIMLLEKAKAGDLSDEEAEALENDRHIGMALGLTKSRAHPSSDQIDLTVAKPRTSLAHFVSVILELSSQQNHASKSC